MKANKQLNMNNYTITFAPIEESYSEYVARKQMIKLIYKSNRHDELVAILK